ncbi:hypothetical protein [Pseudorhodoplanes sp.]|uniref:hypothetical protein n=1 Tax=Pseudorhodoplanes sp. TaxID=1934341 RepID=UPI002B7B7ADC|nr:hypothetical protein [Pseudorhodoplanes sp.]HWV44148.1 hypothetical protein [Pseudorhodoplanes sp.]
MPVRTDQEIVRLLAALDPSNASEIDGSLSCFFCGGWEAVTSSSSNRMFDHEPNCLWALARRKVEEHERNKPLLFDAQSL